MCLLRFYEAQPCEVMEQPQKPANKINHGDICKGKTWTTELVIVMLNILPYNFLRYKKKKVDAQLNNFNKI